ISGEIGRSDAISRSTELQSERQTGRASVDPPFGNRRTEDAYIRLAVAVEVERSMVCRNCRSTATPEAARQRESSSGRWSTRNGLADRPIEGESPGRRTTSAARDNRFCDRKITAGLRDRRETYRRDAETQR